MLEGRERVCEPPQQKAGLAGQAELSVGFVFGLAGITRLFAGVAPVVCLGAGLVMPPC